MNYEDLTPAEREALNIQYIPRRTVPNAVEYLENAARRSAAVREKMECRVDVPYGDTPLQTIDIFPAAAPGSPVQVFIHGGYWRTQDKGTYSEMAAPLVAAGATVVLPNYDLCPAVTIPDIVAQVRNCFAWLHANIAAYNGDPGRIHVSGHSAGGHLTGMMMATDWYSLLGLPRDLVKGTVPMSGLFDIEPHRHTELQVDIRLTKEDAAAFSPQNLDLHFDGPVICAVGGGESEEFKRQSVEFTEKCRALGLTCEYFATGDDDHFAITDRLGDADDVLTRMMITQMGL